MSARWGYQPNDEGMYQDDYPLVLTREEATVLADLLVHLRHGDDPDIYSNEYPPPPPQAAQAMWKLLEVKLWARNEGVSEEAYAAEQAHHEEMLAAHERECGRSITTGPAHDPYATSCHLDRGHEGPHQGPCPFGSDEDWRWEGGGMCAGDPLPVRHLPSTTTAEEGDR